MRALLSSTVRGVVSKVAPRLAMPWLWMAVMAAASVGTAGAEF
jgi:hypothetical protein